MDEIADEELVKQFCAGDDAAFSVFTRRYQDKIYRLACMNLYQQQDAMDVTQEVFLRAYRGLKTFRYRSAPFTWLYRTMKNVCQEYNRKTKRDSIASSEYATELDNITDNSDIETIHYLFEIRQLLKSLPKRQYEVVILRIFEGFSINETASIMKCRPGTVKALMHKAQKQINMLENISYD